MYTGFALITHSNPALSRVVDMLGEIEEGPRQWQAAMVTLSLPMVAGTTGEAPDALA